MFEDNKEEHLLNGLNRKMYFAEIEERLVKVTYSLKADKVYTIDHAILELIKIINLIELEQQALMLEINRIVDISD